MINRFWIAVLIFFVALGIYRSNAGNLYTYDSAPASLFTFNALEHRTLAFDDFRGGYIDGLGGGYAFTEASNGHLEPLFPIGAALLAAPIYSAIYGWAELRGGFPQITDPAFEPVRLHEEKRVANLLAALAAALFFLCASRIASRGPALAATVAFAFGSDMWTVGSQALWQHGSVALVLVGMLLALLWSPPEQLGTRAIVAAGLCAGFLPVIRPTAGLFSLAAAAFVFLYVRPMRVPFSIAVIVGWLPGLIWNAFAFGSLIGGYTIIESSYTFSIAQFVDGLSGLLFSANRGLLIYTPFVVFSIVGAVVVARRTTPQARLLQFLCLASLGTLVNYAFFQRWEGGATFGPRYLTDTMPVAALLLLYAFPSNVRNAVFAKKAYATLAVVAIVVSVGVQCVGANGEPKTNWSGVPDDASLDTARIWDWHDSQIRRDAMATFWLVRANPTAPSAYATGYDGSIVALEPSERIVGNAGASVSMRIRLRNSGTSTWFGYESGLYFGQTRVRVRFLDAHGAIAREDDVFISRTTEPGEDADAVGPVALPLTPGAYTAVFDIDVNQDARIGSRHIGARSIPAVATARS